ncbi:MAG: GlsB/YeaQ/YmgE family stress response membrane protein [Mycobacterium sp.]|nr:GlsB/YeaQ/YmgE family stress response membrane protein [Mycobacterium sp.]
MIGTIIGAIVVGAIIGALARLAMPGRQSVGMVTTILLGIVGSFLGSWITAQFGYHNANGGFAFLPFLVGVLVAAALIGIYVAIAGRHDTTAHR